MKKIRSKRAKNEITLYHFTAREFLPSIACQGLRKGNVPVSRDEFKNAIWLTTDQKPEGHGLDTGRRELTMRKKSIYTCMLYEQDPFPNKRAVRLTVRISKDDSRLVHWPEWSGKHMSSEWHDEFVRVDSNKHPTWYLFWGVIPPEKVLEGYNLLTDGWYRHYRETISTMSLFRPDKLLQDDE